MDESNKINKKSFEPLSKEARFWREKWLKTRQYLREANRGAERNALVIQLTSARVNKLSCELHDKKVEIQKLRDAIRKAWLILDDFDDPRADEWQNEWQRFSSYSKNSRGSNNI